MQAHLSTLRGWWSEEDFLAVGTYALWRCAQRYEEPKGTFATYAIPRIRGAMRDFVRTQRGDLNADRPHFVDIDTETLGVPIPEQEFDLTHVTEALLATLSEAQAEILRTHYGLSGKAGQTPNEIADQRGKPVHSVYNALSAARQSMRREARKRGLNSMADCYKRS